MSSQDSQSRDDPFATPPPTRAPSHVGSSHDRPDSSASSSSISSTISSFPGIPVPRRSVAISSKRMPSHLLEGPVAKPWLTKSQPRARISYLMVYALGFLGLGLGILQCVFTALNVEIDKEQLCLVFSEEFDKPDSEVFGTSEGGGSFFREVGMNGFGNGQFEMATASNNNSFIRDGKLYIMPTLTENEIGRNAVFDGTVYNITGCTFSDTNKQQDSKFFDADAYAEACSAVSNVTAGHVINPVQSARLSTMKTASIRYGRVEVRAKLPTGDWLWPAIWMLPKDEVYGGWPRSGEIDIMESKGNGKRYTAHGNNYVQGTLHWGPAPELNSADKSYSWWSDKRVGFNEGYHTYVLEWTEKFLRISVDTRLHTLLDYRFDRPFFDKGEYPEVFYNKTSSNLEVVDNPWVAASSKSAPFDQEFYLLLGVAVGGSNGWFPEVQGDKPWSDRTGRAAAMRDFARSQDVWYNTWPESPEDRGMVVEHVKMWKHC